MNRNNVIIIVAMAVLAIGIQILLNSGGIVSMLQDPSLSFSDQTRRIASFQLAGEILYMALVYTIGDRIGTRVQAVPAKEAKKAWWLGVAFMLVVILYFTNAILPGWIGRNVIFFAGYYFSISRRLNGHK